MRSPFAVFLLTLLLGAAGGCQPGETGPAVVAPAQVVQTPRKVEVVEPSIGGAVPVMESPSRLEVAIFGKPGTKEYAIQVDGQTLSLKEFRQFVKKKSQLQKFVEVEISAPGDAPFRFVSEAMSAVTDNKWQVIVRLQNPD